MSRANSEIGPRCLECDRRGTYEREMVVRIQLYALTHEGERERLLSEHTPRTIVGYFCEQHAQPFLPEGEEDVSDEWM